VHLAAGIVLWLTRAFWPQIAGKVEPTSARCWTIGVYASESERRGLAGCQMAITAAFQPAAASATFQDC